MGPLASKALNRPSAARVYDYFLGGNHHFQSDREIAEEIRRIAPALPEMMRANRAFVRRAIRFLHSVGIRQFLDLGSGILTVGNVHEIAQRAAPESRVVYVDIDPVAVAHSHGVLAGNSRATALQADIREPEKIFSSPQLQRVLDLSQPVAVLMAGVLPFVPENPVEVVRPYREATVSGSYLLISHVTYEDQPPEILEALRYVHRNAMQLIPRSWAEIAVCFTGYTMVEPGLVPTPLWRPEPAYSNGLHQRAFGHYAGVGFKP